MDTRDEMPTVAQIIARNMRRVRETRDRTRLEVADAARDLGLGWSPALVARIENGRRELTVSEFVALPSVLTLAVNHPVTLADLLTTKDGEPHVSAFGRPGHIADVQALLAEPGVLALRISTIPDRVRQTLDRSKRQAQIARAFSGGPVTEADAIAAKLGMTAPELAKACETLWHRPTVEAECEQRLIESGVDLGQPAKTRLLAEHITRQLTTELNDYLHTS
ncbi:helix-turn-helix transcriptional regulator [Streptosporangiaceae bacterium NEAU-GS5]|nr:helix-turn-helix transcriptional regulator [Streptosporangiaceae bacterium NEAU-GS5]